MEQVNNSLNRILNNFDGGGISEACFCVHNLLFNYFEVSSEIFTFN